MSTALENELNEVNVLFATTPEKFVEVRKRIAKSLEQIRRRSDAAEVLKVRRMPLSVWAINRLYNDDRKRFGRLLAFGDDIRAAQKIGGAIMSTLRREQADLINTMRSSAGKLLADGGHPASAATLRRIDTSLRALSAAGSFVADAPGRLTNDREEIGFDIAFAVAHRLPLLDQEIADLCFGE